MGNRLPTVEEIINTIKRSNIPTILIEGPDDVYVYRYLKSGLNPTLVALQPCGGRTPLFTIYDRRAEFQGKNVVFVADKDAYRFAPIPSDKDEVIFTSGYCIENDIYEGSNIDNFLDKEDIDNHEILKTIIGKWFSFEVEKFKCEERDAVVLNGVGNHINNVSPIGLNEICPGFSQRVGYNEPSEEIIDLVFSEYNLNVRGKQLFQMLSRFLSAKGRSSAFTEKNLIEMALKRGNNEFLDRLVTDINLSLSVA